MHREDLRGDSLFLIHDFFSPEECEQSIRFSEDQVYEDAPITTMYGPRIDQEVRNNRRVIVDAHVLAAKFFERAKPFLPARLDDLYLSGMNERFRYYRYDVGQTFRPHLDGSFRRDRNEESQLTFMVYLNEDFEGGTTNFYENTGRPHLIVRPVRGMALVFVHAQVHEGAPVSRGRKYVLRTDVMYRVLPVERP